MNPIVHNRNLLKDGIIVKEKAEAYQLKKAERLKENRIRINAVRAKYVRELRTSRAAEDRWVRNKKNNINVDYRRRQPVYGLEVDMQLLSAVKERMKLGLPIDAFILRVLLLALQDFSFVLSSI